MNDAEVEELASVIAAIIKPHIERSEVLRQIVAAVGQRLHDEATEAASMGAANEPVRPTSSERPPESPASDNEVGTPVSPQSTAVADSALEHVPLRIGDAAVDIPASGTPEELSRARRAAIEKEPEEAAPRPIQHWDIDLEVVERRCRLKAQSCRLLLERRAGGDDPEVEFRTRHQMNEMITQAKAMPNCFLWVFWREREQPADAVVSTIADAYDAHADAVAAMRSLETVTSGLPQADKEGAFHLLAEANSALRSALSATWLTDDDRDQAEVHVWLRGETKSRHIFIERYMTIDDTADPSNSSDLRRRIRALNTRALQRLEIAKGIKNALGRIRYHAGRVIKSTEESDVLQHWNTIAAAMTELSDLGVVANDRRVTEALGTEAVSSCPSSFLEDSMVAKAVAAMKDTLERASDSTAGTVTKREWSDTVLGVRRMLKGRRVVVIGGEPNAAAADKLIEAFELSDAEWVSLTEHGSGAPMRAPIQRGDTSLVLVILKLTGHLHTDEAKDYATAAGKPCVLLTGGYNPERVAHAVMDQASDRLSGTMDGG